MEMNQANTQLAIIGNPVFSDNVHHPIYSLILHESYCHRLLAFNYSSSISSIDATQGMKRWQPPESLQAATHSR
jgi:hypothetical protein